jgi:hypothetical protein
VVVEMVQLVSEQRVKHLPEAVVALAVDHLDVVVLVLQEL